MRGLYRLAGPMFISSLLQNAQSLIDLCWVGRLGSSSVAALAMSGTILMMLFPAIMGLATGTVAVVSRCVGSRDWEGASRAASQSLTVGVLCGVVASALGWISAGPLCRLLGAEGDVLRLGAQYLRITFLGSSAEFLMFIGNSALQAAGNSVVPMRVLLLSNAVNLVLDPILIFGLLGAPRLEIAGAAIATVIAEIVAAGVVLRVLARGAAGLRLRWGSLKLLDRTAWRILRIGMPSSGQMLSRSLMSAVLMRVVAGFGTVAVAAYGIGVRFHMIVLMPAFAMGNAAATMVGQNLGAGIPGRAERVAWMATGIDSSITLVCAAGLMLFAPALVGAFDPNPAVVQTGAEYLRIVSLFYVLAAPSIVLGRALQGAGDTVSPMIATILGLWGLQVPLALVLPRFFPTPIHGVWWAVAAALSANGLMVAGWFRTGRWKAVGV